MSNFVEGEREQTEELTQQALQLIAAGHNRPQGRLPYWLKNAVDWLARESFRAGYAHAHDRSTLPQKTPPGEAEDWDDGDTPIVEYEWEKADGPKTSK